MVAVSLSGEAYFSTSLSSLNAIGSKTVRRCPAPQPVLTRYKLREIERLDLRSDDRLIGTPQAAWEMWQNITRTLQGRDPLSRSRQQGAADDHGTGPSGCGAVIVGGHAPQDAVG